MNNLKWLRAINLICAAILAVITYCNTSFANNYSLYKTLDNYGFSKTRQKKALENLMHSAKILTDDQNLEDYYPSRNNYTILLEDILNFVQQTQEHLILRKGNQERWEVQPTNWMEKNVDEITENARELGFVEEIIPIQQETDAICILGSTFSSMQKRINYAAELINRGQLAAKNLILLAGERKVSVNIDGDEQHLLQIAKKYNINDLQKLTETHLIQAAYEGSTLYDKLQTFVIDTPAGNLPRPTTETTLVELLRWLSNHKDIKRIVFVSNQPYVKYQEAVISQVLKSANSDIIYEVIGPKVSKDIKTYRIIEGLGSYIWAKTPAVISKFDDIAAKDGLLQEFKKLYGKNPLMYSDIESLFKRDAK